MPSSHRSRLDYKNPALQQIKIFAATRAVRKCERIIADKSALLEELKQRTGKEAITALERELSDLKQALLAAKRNLFRVKVGRTIPHAIDPC